MTTRTTSTDSALLETLRAVDTSFATLVNIRTMPPEQRRLVMLALFVRDGKTKQEVAQMIGVHPSNVGRQLEKAGVITRKPRSIAAEALPPDDDEAEPVLTERERFAMEQVQRQLMPLHRSERRRVLRWARDVLAGTHSTERATATA